MGRRRRPHKLTALDGKYLDMPATGRKGSQPFSRTVDDVELYHQVMANLDRLAPVEMAEMVRQTLQHLTVPAIGMMYRRAKLFLGILNREMAVRSNESLDVLGQTKLLED